MTYGSLSNVFPSLAENIADKADLATTMAPCFYSLSWKSYAKNDIPSLNVALSGSQILTILQQSLHLVI